MERRQIIIDTDPGIDDAVGLAIALFNEKLDVKLITTVAGNVDIDKTTNNVLKLLDFFEKDVPVAKGASKPMIRQLDTASDVHGHSGMDGYEFPEPVRQVMNKHAVEAMRDTILGSHTPITLVPIGPLTNIALLLSTYPEVKNHIDEIVLMGGSITRGNKSPMAEFNIYVDPEAAKIVFHSGIPVVMCGLDVGLKALIYYEQSLKLKETNKTGEMIYSLFSHYRGGSLKTGLKMYDSTAIAYLLAPDMYTVQACFVDIETKGELTYGCTVVDLKNYWKKPANAKVCVDIDAEKFRDWFVKELSKAN